MNPSNRCSRLVSCFALALAASTAHAQCTYFFPPATQEAHAHWGASVAMSGNGQVALVGGPGADGIDGIVRTFSWDGSTWVEQTPLFPEALYAWAAGFGWSVALSYDGNTAAIGAPGDQHAVFVGNQGAVYVFTRDPGTGAWSQQARLVKPAPARQQSFGQAVALSDSGDRLVVGQRNHIGTEYAYVSDSAWVFNREAGVWSAPVELVATNLAATDEYGYAVAVSPDGLRAVVSAAPWQFDADARVFVFRHDGAGWPLEQVLDSPRTNGWAAFGTAVAIGGDVIMVGDLSYEDPEWGTQVGAVHVFHFDGVQWVRQPQVIRNYVHSAGFGQSLALRGNSLLVGEHKAEGAVHIVERMDGQWNLTGTIRSSDPQTHSKFGWSVAIAGDRTDYVIGDPEAEVGGVEYEGRAHFVNAVSAPYDFDVQPTGSTITVTIFFMGFPVSFEISPAGDLIGIVMNDCEEAGNFLLTEATLTNTAERVVFEIPPQVPAPLGGSEVVLSDLRINLEQVGAAAALDDEGSGILAGYRFEISFMTSTAGGEPSPWHYISDPLWLTARLTGGGATPFELDLLDVFVPDVPVDIGLGEFNPTVSVRATVEAAESSTLPSLRISTYSVQAEGFRLEVTGAAGLGVVVEACSDPSLRSWVPVGTGTLTNDPLEVVDADWKNHSVRFYRARSP